MGKPTKDDADIILKLAELSALMGTQAGAEIIWDPEFEPSVDKHPPGSKEWGSIVQLMRWMETIGTLYRNGLVNEDLLFDWLGVTSVWDRVMPFALSIREHSGSTAMWENFEHMAEMQRNWTPKRA
jgi:hypothetical protein